ncbi:hypothetical protein GUJ93_ZPchr0008g11779 [Zizania palustris]|uniref:Uncharacterized protein n=1 Tax=Zizania palustris TaxID=103762 RepID=A0A8J5R5N7_ZIZPA|nr:hypothetical protein GUJ93_ZPchr0008g11779 [Zizania palustris]
MGSKTKTVSRHTAKSEQGTHSFEIVGYSLTKSIGDDKFILSGTFAVGGYDWAIRFYPNGVNDAKYVSVYLELLSKDSEAHACYDLRLVNQENGLPQSVLSESTPRLFKSSDITRLGPQHPCFMLRTEFEKEEAGYIKEDCLIIECAVTVIKKPHLSNTMVYSEIKVETSGLSDHFGKLLLEEEGADVTFVVEGEEIAAHKIILAARSPVFKAEFYGQMKEKNARLITVQDMQPHVFRALLHFIYTDSFPDMDDLADDDYTDMIRLLLVAADRYAMDSMKSRCERILSELLDVETLAVTLALADKHSCSGLKDVCIEFMATLNKMDDMVATEGYADLKRTCPSVLVDAFEKACMFRRISKPMLW